jgi:hypothetical protein
VLKESLIGRWADENEQHTWVFQKSKEFGYVVMNSQREFPSAHSNNVQGDTCLFDAHLIQLGKYYFFDMFPENIENKIQNDCYNFHLIPVHTIY